VSWIHRLTIVVVVLGRGAAACAEPGEGLAVDFATVMQSQSTAEGPADLAATEGSADAAGRRFGAKGSWRWYVLGGYTFDVESASTNMVLLGGGLSYFIVQDVSLVLEIDGLHVDQPGEDSWGGNLSLMFRWHFVSHDAWSMYFEGGCGVLGLTQRVPAPDDEEPTGGTEFNFTPQLGGGFTWAIGDDVRLMTGIRWYHISNARTDDNNPGLDSVLLYAGVTFGF